jgi:pyridoxamine 5'-phosphate oxidase-like protein
MMTDHDARSILESDPAMKALLAAPNVAQLAYTWHDGTPRVVPMWVCWNGEEILMGAPPNSPKMRVLVDRPVVALNIDTTTWPYQVLSIRGMVSLQTISIEVLAESFAEYPAMARRYLGEAGAEQFLAAQRQTFTQWTRIALRPERVRFLNFQTIFPSAWTAGAAGS